MCNDDSPQEQGQERWRDNDRFHKEQNAEFLDGHLCKQGLEDPIDEKAEEPGRGYTSIGGQVVWKILEAWPDSLDAVLEESSRLHAEDGGPHGRNEGSHANGKIGTIHPKDRTGNNREGDVILGTHFGGQGDNSTANGKAEEDDGDCLPSSEPEGHHGGHSAGEWRG